MRGFIEKGEITFHPDVDPNRHEGARMSPSTRRRINAIVQRHLDYYDRFPYTKPKLVIHYSNPGAPWSLGSNSGAERGMFDPDLDAVNPRAGRRAGHHR